MKEQEQIDSFKSEAMKIQSAHNQNILNTDEFSEKVLASLEKHKIKIPSNETFSKIEFDSNGHLLTYHRLEVEK